MLVFYFVQIAHDDIDIEIGRLSPRFRSAGVAVVRPAQISERMADHIAGLVSIL